MDVLKFLQGGNKTPNPEYNPKTKKGAIQLPYFSLITTLALLLVTGSWSFI